MSLPLPSIALPSSLPAFLIADHELAPVDPYARPQAAQGAPRARRLTRSRITNAVVTALLTQAQMETLDDWTEVSLDVASRAFVAKLSGGGARIQYWRANSVAPYTADPQPTSAGLVWMVSWQLLLSGEPSATPPTAANLGLQVRLPLVASASMYASSSLGLSLRLRLEIPASLGLALDLDLVALMASYRLRESIDYRLREGGGKRLRESDV